MGLGVGSKKGMLPPLVSCDGCGEIVADWSRGVVTFEALREDGVGPAKVYHKGKCDPAGLGRPRPADAARWMELADYFAYLLWNYGLGEKSVAPGNGRQITLKVPDRLDII